MKNKHARIEELLRKDRQAQYLKLPWGPPFPFSDEEKARMNALYEIWLEALSYNAQMKIVREMVEVIKDNLRREWIAKNPGEPEENFYFPVGADLPMYQDSFQTKKEN